MRTCVSERRPLVAYIRVSTSRQGRSGLGIEGQRAALARFAETEGFEAISRRAATLCWIDLLPSSECSTAESRE
jgi:hypothetical protein